MSPRKRKRAGRPALPKADRLSVIVRARLTVAEAASVLESGVSVRTLLLGGVAALAGDQGMVLQLQDELAAQR